MPRRHSRKTPVMFDRKHSVARLMESQAVEGRQRLPGWFPPPDGDFKAWAAAANRAHQELHESHDYLLRHSGDSKAKSAYKTALAVWHKALERAYPPGFWEICEKFGREETTDLEPLIVFLEADPYFFRSGYIKGDLIRWMKRLPITSKYMERLRAVILLVVDKAHRREFREYGRLARKIQTPEFLQELRKRLNSEDADIALRAKWILAACQQAG